MTIYPEWRRPKRIIVGKDLYYDQTSLLLPLNGVNNGTTFTDFSKYNNSITRVGTPVTSTSQSKFGGSSGAFLTNGSYLTTPRANQFIFEAGNFTIESWIYPLNPLANPFSVERCIFGLWSAVDPGGQAFMLYLDGGNLKFISDIVVNDNVLLNVGGVITTERWYHVAVVRNGTTFLMFIDGTQRASYNAGSSAIVTGNNSLGVGGYSRGTTSPATFYGYIGPLRVTKDIARYTTDFNIPTLTFPTR